MLLEERRSGELAGVPEQQLARIEAELGHVATRAWVLGGVQLGGMGVAAMVAVALMKLFV